MPMDIEDLYNKTQSVKHLVQRGKNTRLNNDIFIDFVKTLCDRNYNDQKEYKSYFREQLKKYKLPFVPRPSEVNYMYRKLYEDKIINYSNIQDYLVTKKVRVQSGILEVAVLTSPWDMQGKHDGCNFNCYYCPKQEGMPRSYIKEEPAVKRAADNDFDCVRQVTDRLSTYDFQGHTIDKIEGIILGGTWSQYNDKYKKEFMRDFYYAANTYYQVNKRERFTLAEEKFINETTLCKVIGLTIETRPDEINEEEIKKLLSYGVTRVQIGVQTTHDFILKKINRQCYSKDTVKALYLLKNAGLKTMTHLMPNLPFSDPDLDKDMFSTMLYNPDYLSDEWKIYPTSVTTTSEKDNTEVLTIIEKWYQSGKYVPYSNEELFELLVWVKQRVPPYLRIARVFRDIPLPNIIGGATVPNMREELKKMMPPDNPCKCIRCREIKDRVVNRRDIKYTYRKIKSSGATEYFLSYESFCKKEKKTYIHAFLRLRLPNTTFIKVLQDNAIVRELHVYGQMRPTYKPSHTSNKDSTKTEDNSAYTQHKGLGSSLLKRAEWIAYFHGYKGIAITSGVGVRRFYSLPKNGYSYKEYYMVKSFYTLSKSNLILIFFIILTLMFIFLALF